MDLSKTLDFLPTNLIIVKLYAYDVIANFLRLMHNYLADIRRAVKLTYFLTKGRKGQIQPPSLPLGTWWFTSKETEVVGYVFYDLYDIFVDYEHCFGGEAGGGKVSGKELKF